MSWTKISESVHRWTDTCQVYAIVRDDHCLLIDAGSGALLNHLRDIAVTKVDWVLHTHHHRDQCWGTNTIRARGAQVAVPEHESHLFEKAEVFWSHKRVYDNYNDRSTFNTVGENIPVDQVLKDYETFTWKDLIFTIIPAKGHTHGSSLLLADIDGHQLAFTGDLLSHGGVLHEYHGLEYNYGDRQGALFTLESCQALRRHAPDIALPSHGEVITDPARVVIVTGPACVVVIARGEAVIVVREAPLARSTGTQEADEEQDAELRCTGRVRDEGGHECSKVVSSHSSSGSRVIDILTVR